MESEERVSSAAPTHASNPKASSRSSPVHTHTTLGSALSTCGHLFRTASDQPLSMSSVSSGFPLMGHPAFSLFPTVSGRSEFGGLGTLGVTAGLTTHPQLGAFPELWRFSEAQGRGGAAIFPALLGLPPLFTAPGQSQEPSPLQSHMPSKNGRNSAKGVNGALNGSVISSAPSGGRCTPSPALGSSEQTKTPTTSTNHAQHCKSHTDSSSALSKKTKDKKLCKKTSDVCSNSDSQSDTSSDSSSDGGSSSDIEDLDDEDDDDDQSTDSEDSDSETERRVKRKGSLTQTALDSVLQRPTVTEDHRTALFQKLPQERPLSVCFPPQLSPQPPTLLFQSPRGREEPSKHHTSVIQSTGLAASAKPLALVTQPRHETSPKPLSLSSSPKHHSISPSPKALSLCSSPKPLSLSSSPKPPSLSSSPKPPTLSPKHKAKAHALLTKAPTLLSDSLKMASRSYLDEALLHISHFKLKQSFSAQEYLKQAFPLQLKTEKRSAQRRTPSSSSLLSPLNLPTASPASHKLPPPSSSTCTSTPLSGSTLHRPPYANGYAQEITQDAPLALITRPRGQSPAPDKPLLAATSPGLHTPINLTTGAREQAPGPATLPRTPSSPRVPQQAGSSPRNGHAAHAGKGRPHNHLVQSLVDLFRSAEADMPSSKDSDESAEDEDGAGEDDDEDDDDDDSDDSLSDSESNLDSDSDISDNISDNVSASMDTKPEGTPLSLSMPQPVSGGDVPSSMSDSCSPLNLQVVKTPATPTSSIVTLSAASTYHSTPSSSCSLATPPGSGSGRRRRVTDERELRVPLEYGWQREVRIRTVDGGRLQGHVAYYAPCGKKLKQYPDVVKYLARNGITNITRDHFSFSAKIRVGSFFEAREGAEGLHWSLLNEEQVTSRIQAMEGRRGRPPNPEHQHNGRDPQAKRRKFQPLGWGDTEAPSAADAKLLRKLEAQEIARQAAQIKLMRKLEKQALARAAKEARKQQAIMAAEQKRKQKEQMKLLKQQEKIKRIQQIRMEKEFRAQQILEAKKKKREEAANAKILEAERRIKEKEMRRQQAALLKHQEMERHRLDMERERRRQHMMLMKAMEAKKKAEERERLKQERRDEKRLNKERRLELRRLELEMARELKRPTEDMCLADHKALPEFSRVQGLVLPSSCFADCLMVLQFLRSFWKVLGLDLAVDVPSFRVLQEGLLNIGDSMGPVQDLLVRLLATAVSDSGLPPGHRAKTALGEHLTSVGINRDNVSEILQIYMEAHCGQTELAPLTESLKTKAFQAHTPTQKASILAFLVNELASTKSVVSEIDKNIDHMTNLRKDKWVIEGNIRKLRSILAKRTGKRDCTVGEEEGQALGTPTSGSKRKRKGPDSEEDEDEEEDSEEQGEDDDEEEEDVKKGKKAETEEDEGDQTASVEELEKQLEKLVKQQCQIRRKLFEYSHSLRSMMFGQDRFRRRYWVLPQCGGVFVEGMETGEAPEELQRERERQQNSELVEVKEEPMEVVEEPPLSSTVEVKLESDNSMPEMEHNDNSLNLFLQKPGSFSKLSKLLEVAKMSPESESFHGSQNDSPGPMPTIAYSPSNTQTTPPSVCSSAPIQPCPEIKQDPGTPLLSSPDYSSTGNISSPQQPIPNDQLFRVLTEKNGHWFSLLPRSPCDESSLTASPTHPSSSQLESSLKPRAASSPISAMATSSHDVSATNSLPLTALQGKSAMLGAVLPFSGWLMEGMSPHMALASSALPPTLGAPYPTAEGTASPFLPPSVAAARSECPGLPSDKSPSAPSPAMEVAKPQDYPNPKPIPEEMLTGWWKVADIEELRSLVKTLHCRGVREKALQKQLQKHMDYIMQACAKHRDVTTIDVAELEENQVTVETVERWCVEEQAMEMDIAMLQQVEELERRVTSASLQVKGWMHPEPQSESEDLVYHEHKVSATRLVTENGEERLERADRGLERKANNPLDIAVTRLAELEKSLERRYLKSPLSTSIQLRLEKVGMVTMPAPPPSSCADGDWGEEAPGMKVWRKALSEVRSAGQLALCIQQLQKSISWERSIMKVYCQICRKGDNEELLLLCDGCDKGCHTYCHKPKITTIPEGDWFCPACITTASGQSLKSKKQQRRPAGAGKKASEPKRSREQGLAGDMSEEDGSASTSASSTPKKTAKDSRKRRAEESPVTEPVKQDSPPCVKKAKTAKDNNRDLTLCRILLVELEGHRDAWPFLTPVNPKSVPGYKKVIKKPMDFSTIREKLINNQYLNLETFIIDVNLVFDNCEKFNEDNSDIGRAGHNMRRFFEKRWMELLKQN